MTNKLKYSVIYTSIFKKQYKVIKKQGKDILEACIIDLENFEQPEKKEMNNSDINIYLTQNQNQTVSVSLFISALSNLFLELK